MLTRPCCGNCKHWVNTRTTARGKLPYYGECDAYDRLGKEHHYKGATRKLDGVKLRCDSCKKHEYTDKPVPELPKKQKAYWLDCWTTDGYGKSLIEYTCSKCEATIRFPSKDRTIDKFKYCFNCGEKMERKQENEGTNT